MSDYDNAFLLAAFKDWAQRPATDLGLTDPKIYRLLTAAQAEVWTEVATHAPAAIISQPQLMVTADSGSTYTFGTDAAGENIFPMGYTEIYALDGAIDLFGSTYTGCEGDIVFEGDRVRIPRGRTRAFSNGPYWRGVTAPPAIDAGTQPVLKPKHARMLIVYRALEKYAALGELHSGTKYSAMFTRAWSGNPDTGEAGLLGMYRTQFKGGAASSLAWWRRWANTGGASSLAMLLDPFADGSITADGGV